jgi:hypothetical protein
MTRLSVRQARDNPPLQRPKIGIYILTRKISYPPWIHFWRKPHYYDHGWPFLRKIGRRSDETDLPTPPPRTCEGGLSSTWNRLYRPPSPCYSISIFLLESSNKSWQSIQSWRKGSVIPPQDPIIHELAIFGRNYKFLIPSSGNYKILIPIAWEIMIFLHHTPKSVSGGLIWTS